jgi:hypothetical protein
VTAVGLRGRRTILSAICSRHGILKHSLKLHSSMEEHNLARINSSADTLKSISKLGAFSITTYQSFTRFDGIAGLAGNGLADNGKLVFENSSMCI